MHGTGNTHYQSREELLAAGTSSIKFSYNLCCRIMFLTQDLVLLLIFPFSILVSATFSLPNISRNQVIIMTRERASKAGSNEPSPVTLRIGRSCRTLTN